jgi:hypothetical protein
MSTTHTPGPWTWEGQTLRPVNRDPRTSSVYSILHDDCGGFGFLASKPSDTVAELDADRALIAAAPDLLAALRSLRDAVAITRGSLLDSVDTHGTHGGWLDQEARRLMAEEDACDAAIAKATGAAA